MKRPGLFIQLVVMVAVAVLVLWLVLPRERVSAELIVSPEHFLYEDVFPEQRGDLLGDYVEQSIRLMTYPFVLTAAMRDPRIANLECIRQQPKPEDWLREQIKASADVYQRHAFITVSFRNALIPSDDAALIVNAVANAFREEVIDRQRQQQFSQLNELQDLLKVEHVKLHTMMKELTRTTEKDNNASRHQAYRQELETELAKQRAALTLAEARLSYGSPTDEIIPAGGEESDEDFAIVSDDIGMLKQVICRLNDEVDAIQGNAEMAMYLQVMAEDIAYQKSRVRELSEREYRMTVELKYQEDHPPIRLVRKAKP